jgi:hypothetical protein
MELTKGAISKQHNTSDCNSYNPIVQVLEITELKDQRIARLVISDGEYRNQVIGSSSLNDLYRNKQLKYLDIVVLLKYSRTFIRSAGLPVVVVNDLQVVGSADETIGYPAPYKHVQSDGTGPSSLISESDRKSKEEEGIPHCRGLSSDPDLKENGSEASFKKPESVEMQQDETQHFPIPVGNFREIRTPVGNMHEICKVPDSYEAGFNVRPTIYIEDTNTLLDTAQDLLEKGSDKPPLVQSKLSYGKIVSNKKVKNDSFGNMNYTTSKDINFFPRKSFPSQSDIRMPVQKIQYPFVNPVMNSPNHPETPARIPRYISDSSIKETDSLHGSYMPSPIFSPSYNPPNCYTPSSLQDFSSFRVSDVCPRDLKTTEFISSSNQDYDFTPIAHMYPYNTDWIIKARIYSKSSIQSGRKNSGNLYFKIQLIDKFSDEIEALFSGSTVHYFYNSLIVDRVYLFSNGSIRPTDKPRPNYPKAVYQIYFPKEANIVEIEDDGSIPAFQYRFSRFNDVTEYKQDSVVDVVGRVIKITEIDNRFPSNPELKQRKITITDTDRNCLDLVLWNQMAELDIFNHISSAVSTVIAVKNGLVREYRNSKYITILEPTDISINPQIPQTSDLKLIPNIQPLISRQRDSLPPPPSSLKDIKDFDLATLPNEKKKYFNVQVFLGHVQDVTKGGVFYPSCEKLSCRKKVFREPSGMYYCAKCNRIYDNCIYRYKLTLKVHDNTDFLWINAFSDTAEKILGMSAQELHHICEYEDEEFRYILSNLLNKSYSAVISLKNLDGRPQYTLEKVSERRDTQETAMSYVNEIKSLLNMRAF